MQELFSKCRRIQHLLEETAPDRVTDCAFNWDICSYVLGYRGLDTYLGKAEASLPSIAAALS